MFDFLALASDKASKSIGKGTIMYWNHRAEPENFIRKKIKTAKLKDKNLVHKQHQYRVSFHEIIVSISWVL